MRPPGHTRPWNISWQSGRLSEFIAFAGIFLACITFVPNVFDGTFLKPLILQATCAVIVTIEVVRWIGRRSLYPPFTRPHLFFLFYIVACALSLWPAPNLRLGFLAILQQCSLFIVFSFACRRLGLQRTIGALLIVSAAVCAVALAHLVLPASAGLYAFANQLATLSTFGNQSYFAGFLVLVLPLIGAEILFRRNAGQNILFPSLLAIAAVYLLVTTESRSGWVAAVAGIFLLFVLTLKNRKALLRSAILSCLILAGIFLLFRTTIEPRISALLEGGPQSSVERRISFYEGAFRAFLSSPIIGNGVGNFVVFLPRFRPADYWMVRSEDIVAHAHNEFLEILSETGIIGLSCYLLLIGAIVWALSRLRREAGEREGILIAGVIAATAGVMIDNLSSMNLRTIPVAVCLWTLLGSALRPAGQSQRLSPKGDREPSAIIHIAAAIAVCVEIFSFVGAGIDRYAVQSEFLEGFMLHTQSRAAEAAHRFENVLSLDPHHAEARFYLTADLLQNGDAAAAMRHARALRAEYPYYPKAGTLEAVTYLELGDSAMALATINEELRRSRSPLSLYYASTIARHMGRDEDVLDYLTELLRANVRSGLKDFGNEALAMLLDVRYAASRAKELEMLLSSYKEKFSGDSTLVRGVEANLRRIAVTVR